MDALCGVGPELLVYTVRLRATHWWRAQTDDAIPLSHQLEALEEMQEAARRGRVLHHEVRLPSD